MKTKPPKLTASEKAQILGDQPIPWCKPLLHIRYRRQQELTEAEIKHIKLIHEEARHSKTVRNLEYVQSVADGFVAAIQDLTGEYYGEHSNENDPWENALSAIQEMADAKHDAVRKWRTRNTTRNTKL